MLLYGHNGGLGIRDPVNSSTLSFQSSREGSKILSDSIIDGISLEMDLHETQMKKSIQHMNSEIALNKIFGLKHQMGCPYTDRKPCNELKMGSVLLGFQ